MPEPWATILAGLTGPYGVVIAEAVVIFFLWKLFRESEREGRDARDAVTAAVETLKTLSSEIRSWREVTTSLVDDLRKRRAR